ncbi:ribosome recycling factor [Mycoplasmopsis opalescens]|uniref:ribosome recycling factor n=1 Tax=Mycoplasmopsis opalescens TaxID=114886 RepID=UPI0004A6DC2B|nr:ribosome recycling factor [Mycoplasmopsis opalescens]
MDFDEILLMFEDACQGPIDHYAFELSKISTGRANPQVVKGIRIDYYDTMTPLEEIANITIPEPQQLLIKPYDATTTKLIAKAIMNANLGVNPVDEGHQVRLTFPPLTAQRRQELAKSLTKLAEQAKVGIRNARQDANKMIKNDESISEDLQKRYLEDIQKQVDSKMNHINDMTAKKEKELMTI